jgi:hypothetical protein
MSIAYVVIPYLLLYLNVKLSSAELSHLATGFWCNFVSLGAVEG